MREVESIFTALVTLLTALGGGYAWYAKHSSEKRARKEQAKVDKGGREEAAREGIYRNLLDHLQRLEEQVKVLELKIETLTEKVDERDAQIDRWQAGFYTLKRLVQTHGSADLIEKVEDCAQKVLSETRDERR